MVKEVRICQLILKKSRHPVRGRGVGGVNPYGQPDRKKTVFFLTTALSFARLLKALSLSGRLRVMVRGKGVQDQGGGIEGGGEGPQGADHCSAVITEYSVARSGYKRLWGEDDIKAIRWRHFDR